MTSQYCYICKNYTGNKFVGKTLKDTCKAFPKGIPVKIILLEEAHETVREDQVGEYIFNENKPMKP